MLNDLALDMRHRPELVAHQAIPAAAKLLAAPEWPSPEGAAWLLCRLAQGGDEAHAEAINVGAVPHLKKLLDGAKGGEEEEEGANARAVAAAAALGALGANNPK